MAKQVNYIAIGTVIAAVLVIGLVSGFAISGAAVKPKLYNPNEVRGLLLSKQDVLNMLNKCTLGFAGDNDHLVDYNTFPNNGAGVCNTICNNAGKTCVAAYFIAFSSYWDPTNTDRDIATLPRLCSDNNHEYEPFDELTGYYPSAMCMCCSP